jgi:hypothetical protein
MVLKKVPVEINQVLEADRDHAQILIELTDSSKSLGEARRILWDLGICIVDMKICSAGWVLLKLDAKDMRDAILKLTENGFVSIKGVNAIPKKKEIE